MEAEYEVDHVVGLPVMEERVVYTKSDGEEITDHVATGETIRKEPGSTITYEEFQEAQQSDEQIQTLIDDGAIHAVGDEPKEVEDEPQ